VGEPHKKMVSVEEFDVYIRLFFIMCRLDINFHKAVGPTFEKNTGNNCDRKDRPYKVHQKGTALTC